MGIPDEWSLLALILSFGHSYNYYFVVEMRLLLLQKPSSPSTAHSVPNSRVLGDTLIPVIENTLTKRCYLEEFPPPNHLKVVFYSTADTEMPAYSYRLAVEVGLADGRVTYRSTFLKDCSPLLLSSPMRVNIMHKANRKAVGEQTHVLEVDHTGQVSLLRKMHYSTLLMRTPNQLGREVAARVKALVAVSLPMLQWLLMETNAGTRIALELRAGRAVHLQKVKRHIYFSCYDLGLSEKASQYRHPTEETLNKREKIIQSLLSPPGAYASQLRESVLFGRQEGSNVANSKDWRREFQSTYYFQKLLQVPAPKPCQPGENPFIFNQIQLDRPDQVVAQDLPGGGGCLKVMAVSAAYVGTRDEKPVYVPKVLVGKLPRGESGKQRGKVLHERNIMRVFSSAHSGYLLKYYQCFQQTFTLRHSLLMDYHPGAVTLLEHLQLRKESFSMEGRLGLLAHLSNALRFLAYYKVAHMDLTFSNVLVYDGYMPRLIDFGEAYHRDTVQATLKGDYSPGFTLPYCAPEVFKGKQFSSAQDIFSFGVVIFRVLLNMLPFFPADSLVAIYKAKTYHSRLLVAPEGLAAACHEQVCFLLLQLVNLCLRAEQQARPLPIWTTIILKEILTEIFL